VQAVQEETLRAVILNQVPFRLLKASEDNRTPLYGRPFKCSASDCAEVALFAAERKVELEKIQRPLAGRRNKPSRLHSFGARSKRCLCLALGCRPVSAGLASLKVGEAASDSRRASERPHAMVQGLAAQPPASA
jgi:hypothetical protein